MDFHKLLKESIEGESEDISRYEKMAAMAPEEYEPILHDIAKEESQHLHFLNEMAEKTGWGENEGTNEEENHGDSAMNESVEKLHTELNEIKTLILELHSLVMTKYQNDEEKDSHNHSSEPSDENDEPPESEQTSESAAPSNSQPENGTSGTMPATEDSTQRIIR